MAQTILIKRSTSTSIPSALNPVNYLLVDPAAGAETLMLLVVSIILILLLQQLPQIPQVSSFYEIVLETFLQEQLLQA
jgi:hypothetical protein